MKTVANRKESTNPNQRRQEFKQPQLNATMWESKFSADTFPGFSKENEKYYFL